MEFQTKTLLKYLILPLGLLLTAVVIALVQTRPDFKLHVNFFDSGAVLIRTYQGNKILVNGGANDRILSELGKALPFFDRKIDLVILTEANSSRTTGLIYVLKRYDVGQILFPTGDLSDSAGRELLAVADQKQVAQKYLSANQRLWLDSGTVLDLPAGQIRFGEVTIKIFGRAAGETVSDGRRVDRK